GASDMVLADDNFATIINAVEEGRKVYSNIKKAIQSLLSTNIAEVLCLFIVTMIMPAGTIFLTPVMILWVNLVTDSLPALALGMEKAEPDIMNDPPRKQGSSLFSGITGKNVLIQGVLQTIIVLSVYFIGFAMFNDIDPRYPSTMAFVSLCMIELFHAYNCRSQDKSLFRENPLSNKHLNLAFLVGTVLLGIALVLPFMQTAFNAILLTPLQFAISLGFAILIIPFVEVQKAIENAIIKKRVKN
ncbi:MAG: cation transporting ATPase C-terminal domain-containing protein, partial [Bacillota bacterium]